jgi:hypothetical protein
MVEIYGLSWARQGSRIEIPKAQILCDSFKTVLTVLESPNTGETGAPQKKHTELEAILR